MRPRVGFLVVGLSAAAVTVSAQRFGRDTISVDSARALLGSELLVVPGLPIRGIYALGQAVLVVQHDDSGEVVILREQRGGSWLHEPRGGLWFRAMTEVPNHDALRAAENTAALLERRLERRLDNLRRQRYFEPVHVRVVSGDGPRNWQAVLDRLVSLR